MNPFAPAAFWGFWILLVAGWMMGEAILDIVLVLVVFKGDVTLR